MPVVTEDPSTRKRWRRSLGWHTATPLVGTNAAKSTCPDRSLTSARTDPCYGSDLTSNPGRVAGHQFVEDGHDA